MPDNHQELENELAQLAARVPETAQTPWQNYTVVKGLSLLGLSVVRLDKTSTRLAKVNIWLTVVILLVGIVQIVLMVRGH
jgi:hypothetical protein